MTYEQIEEQIALMTNYLGNGGYFNPELMEHDKVRDMIITNRNIMQAILDRILIDDILI